MSEEVELDEQQRACVQAAGNTHMMVTAIPGSGKTRTIAARCQHLLQQGVPGRAILVLTFTNKAAAELKSRVHDTSVRCGTFHALALQLLQEAKHGMFADEVVLVTDSRAPHSFFTNFLRQHGVALLAHASALTRAYHDYRTSTAAPVPAVASIPSALTLTAFEQYQAFKRRRHEADFDDLLHEWHSFLEAATESDIQHVLVDEAQDCNNVQFDIVQQLVRLGARVAAVGDVDQCIYGFRGSNITHLANFAHTLPGTVEHTLHMNYRSTPEICAVAQSIIEFNTLRTRKDIVSAHPPGAVPALYPFDTVADEHRFVTEVCQKALLNSVECAVLCRTNKEVDELEKMWQRKAMPYTLLRGLKLFDSPHVKALLSLLTFVFCKDPSKVTVVDALAMHRGVTRQAALDMCTRWQGDTEEDSLCAVFLKQAPSGWPLALVQLHSALKRLQHAIACLHATDHNAFAVYVAQLASACVHHTNAIHQYTLEQLRDLEQVSELLEEQPSFDAFVSGIQLGTLQVEQQANSVVKLGTIHQAKGLEFECVVVPGCVNGNIPSFLSRTPPELEEERRLLYVAATRAKEQLCFTFALHAQPQWGGGEPKSRQLSTFLMPLLSYLLVKQNTQLVPSPMKRTPDGKLSELLSDFYRVFGRHNALVTMCTQRQWHSVDVGLTPAPPSEKSTALAPGHTTCLLLKRVLQECLIHTEWSWEKCVHAACHYVDGPNSLDGRAKARVLTGNVSDGKLPPRAWPHFVQQLQQFADRLLAAQPAVVWVQHAHVCGDLSCTVDLLLDKSLFAFVYDLHPPDLLLVHLHAVAACLQPAVTTLVLVNLLTGQVRRQAYSPLQLLDLPLPMQAHAVVQLLTACAAPGAAATQAPHSYRCTCRPACSADCDQR